MIIAVIVLMIIGILLILGALSGLERWIEDADFKDMGDTI
jgi:hypothetical protein